MSEIDKQSAEKEPTPVGVEQASTIARHGLNRKRELRYLNPEQQAQREQEHKRQDRHCLDYLLQHSDDEARFARPRLITFLARELKLDVQIVADTINRLRHRGLVTVGRPSRKSSATKGPINSILIDRKAASHEIENQRLASNAPEPAVDPALTNETTREKPETIVPASTPPSLTLPGQQARLDRIKRIESTGLISQKGDKEERPELPTFQEQGPLAPKKYAGRRTGSKHRDY